MPPEEYFTKYASYPRRKSSDNFPVSIFRYAIYEPMEYEDGMRWIVTGMVVDIHTAERFIKKIKDAVVRDTRIDEIVLVKKEK